MHKVSMIDVDIDINVILHYEHHLSFVERRKKRRSEKQSPNYIYDRSSLLSPLLLFASVWIYAHIALNKESFMDIFNCTLKAFTLIGFMRFSQTQKKRDTHTH